MSTKRRIFKNTAVLASADIFTRLMRFALAIVIARTLGPEGYGIYAFAISFAELYGVISDFGMSNVIILIVESALSLVAYGFLFLLVGLMDLPQEKAVIVYIAVLAYMLTALAQIVRATFKAHEKMEYDAVLNIIQQSVTVVLGIIVLYFGYGLVALALAFVVGSLVNLAASLALASKRLSLIHISEPTRRTP